MTRTIYAVCVAGALGSVSVSTSESSSLKSHEVQDERGSEKLTLFAELWEESGRWDLFGPLMLKIKDRHGRDFAFGPRTSVCSPRRMLRFRSSSTQPGRTRAVREIFVRCKISAENRLKMKRPHKVCIDLAAIQPDRILLGEIAIGTAWLDGRDRLERRLPRTPFDQIRPEHEFARLEWRGHAERNQLAVFGIGEAAEKNPIHDAEDRSR